MAKHLSPCENADDVRTTEHHRDEPRLIPTDISLSMRKSARANHAGSVLPAIVVGLAAIGLLAVAGFQSASFGRAAARAAMAAGAALHAADSGLEFYGAGGGPAVGAQGILAPPGRGDLVAERLVRLNDSSFVVLLRSEGTSPATGPSVGRRSLSRLFRVEGSTRTAVQGSWRERI